MSFHQVGIVVSNQAPLTSLFDPYPREAILLRDNFPRVLPPHRREARLHSGVAVHADQDIVSRDRLELQASRCEISKDIFFRSACPARTDPDEVICVYSIERRRIRIDLRLNALSIHLPDLLDNSSFTLALRLRMSRNGSQKQETTNHEASFHEPLLQNVSLHLST